ncbi:MAG: xanthine dehydrogenase family protein molybdopterin-binding subunit [Myxococcales bacterium]|nr:xanthine dehydrogenase family protein molybdopterin-binding subunit [Myxococcales bacterium]
MSEAHTLSRRRFLQVSGGAASGLLLGFTLPVGGRLAGFARAEGAQAPRINAWLQIAPDESVVIRVGSSEMGQGVLTALPMLVAEELEVEWTQVRAEMAPADAAYANRIFGSQATGGSTSVRQGFDYLREAGATAREMLRRAAAERWGVGIDACVAEKGRVIHRPTARALSYGSLAAEAARLAPPERVALKEPKSWSLLGKPRRRLDTLDKSSGRAIFGCDVRVPGMLFGTLMACPVFGGRLARVDPAPAQRLPGVKAVVSLDDAVIVVADTTWNARTGLRALAPVWDEGPHAETSSAQIRGKLRAALDGDVARVRSAGDAPAVLSAAPRTHEAIFEVPFLAHAAMEPMNATVHARADGADVWVPTQSQERTQQRVAEMLGLRSEQVRIHTTFLGGGFGRRSETDFVAYAVAASRAAGAPVQVFWWREEDMRHDFYRPASTVRMRAALDAHGAPVALHARVACPSILARVFPDALENGVDDTAVEGLDESPYAIANQLIEYARVDTPVPVGFWRSVGHSQNAFVLEAFLDELARAAGADPLAYRLALLAGHPRHAAVLRRAAEMAGWGTPPAAGRHRGLALHESFDSIVAEVAEISIEAKRVRVHAVYCAVDCGTVINPDTVEAQMQSAILYGLTAALHGEITIEKGRVQQSNFSDYPALILGTTPAIYVHIMQNAGAPGGVGEPGTPPIAPAVANAVFAATGTPVRALPIRV